MRRRRRRTKYTWFPNLGAAAVLEGVDDFPQLKFQLSLANSGAVATAISPITHDAPHEGNSLSQDETLVTVLGNEYVVKRIVGKLLLSCQQPEDDVPTAVFPKTALVAAGFFVARANDANSGGGFTTPIGSATSAESNDNYSPLSLETVREPYMFRRVWMLSTGRATPPTSSPSLPFSAGARDNAVVSTAGFQGVGAPQFNGMYGSVLDGPHFDVKSARRIRQDERLWFVVSARVMDNEWTTTSVPNTEGSNMIAGILDYRVLGQLRKAKNSGTF